MATNTSKLSPTELDFDLIKAELKRYLKSQDEFTEYDFEGSAMNVLMDVLSYNTHMNAFMANMMANEMFLDSASIRTSVVSKAKEIGYVPRSVRTSKSNVNISVDNKHSVITDIYGEYTISGLTDGVTYNIKPYIEGYSFDPVSANVTISSANEIEVNFNSTYNFFISCLIFQIP
jgi:hypothetical protein